MKTSAFVAGLLVAGASRSLALQIPVQRRADSSGKGVQMSRMNSTLFNGKDLSYLTTVTIADQDFKLIIDTGSSDLWIAQNAKGVGSSGIGPVNIPYGTGGVSGNVSFAPFSVGSYKVDSQAFLNNANFSLPQLLSQVSADGLLGLSFDAISSIDITVALATNDTSRGRMPLTNIFASHPSLPNTLSILLTRTDDLEDISGGSFLIGEEADGYEDVLKAPQLQRFKPDGFSGLWTVWMDGATINGNFKALGSALEGAPKGKSLTLLDTGTTTAFIPSSLARQLYGSIPGSFMSGNTTWVVPCMSASNVSFTFGGQVFPVHPLDLTAIQPGVAPDGTNFTYCVGYYQVADVTPETFKSQGQDLLFGDAFLRNVYASFDYGNDSVVRLSNGTLKEAVSENPYVQLLKVTDQDKAWTEFFSVRKQTLQKFPPEPSLDKVRQYLGANASASSDSSQNDAKVQGDAVSGAAASDDSDSTSKLLDQMDKYSPIVIGLLAGNLLIGVLLCAIALAACMRRGTSTSTRSVNPTYAPVRFKDGEESQKMYAPKYND
ncbi:hypothetical protein EWM64_g7849 [Hericium alpestre]|uniref:Peptidase A1 domain-containing protein n=1 Tax=Hericium alpestre TaxID=135208 RepID=A0A4Y9ZQ61_9AGAM|nr:hypothetical protein EWM64_g7849 [Hericium alpestre]